MRKIAFVMPMLLPMPPVRGGAVETLVNGLLLENEKSGSIEFHVYCVYDKEAEKAAAKYKYTRFHMYRPNKKIMAAEHFAFRVFKKLFGMEPGEGREYIARVVRDLECEKWDAVIVENETFFSYITAKRLKNVPVYAHIHNDIINGKKLYSAGAVKYCAGVLAISRYIKNRAMTARGASERKIQLLPNCIDTEKFGTEQYSKFRKDFREKHDIGEDDIVFMFAGRVIPEKGVLELAKAFARLGMRNAWLMVVGSGWFSEDIRDEYLEAVKHELESVKDRVILTGYVPFDDMPEYYAVADAAVLPSVWEEPASLTVIESLAAGLPLITTDAGGIAETADESCAFVLKRGAALSDNIAECMSRLAEDAELRRTMSAGAAERVSVRDYGAYYRKFVIAVTKA